MPTLSLCSVLCYYIITVSSNKSIPIDEGATGLEQFARARRARRARRAEDSADGLVEDHLEAFLREGRALKVLQRAHVLRHCQALKSVASVISVIPGSYLVFNGLKISKNTIYFCQQ